MFYYPISQLFFICHLHLVLYQILLSIIKPLLKNYNLNPNILSNYRPVSNLPLLSKVLQRLVINQRMNHIKRNGLK